MAVIRTVCGDIPAEQAGITYLHEHLIGHSLKPNGDPDLVLDSEAVAIKELRLFHQAGGRTLVEMSPRDYGRNPRAYQRIADASDVNIVCVAGFIKGSTADAIAETMTIEQMADEFTRDVCDGIGDTGIRAGLLKAGSSKDHITPNEEKVFRAVARAYHATGALISTHTEAGTMALEQIALLTSEGVPPGRILIGHLDRKLDWDYHLAIAQTGVILGYDQFGKEKYAPDHVRVDFVARMVQAGYRDQLALSGDMARRSNFTNYGGGPGYTFILWRILPWLREAGLTHDDINALMVRTPARLLALDA